MTNKQEVAIEHFRDMLLGCKYNGSDLIIDLDDAEAINELLEKLENIDTIIYEIQEISESLSNRSYDLDNIIDNLKEIVGD